MHHSTHRAPSRTLGIREAARELGLAHTTIGRYVRAFPELNRGSDGRPRVDLDQLRRHRAANLDPAPRGRAAAKLIAEGPPATGADASPSYSVSKAAREAILADRAQVDLDEKRGLLVSRREIEDAIYDAGTGLLRDLLDLGAQLAERLAAMSEPREIAALLETEHRRVLATLAASLRADSAAEEEPRPK